MRPLREIILAGGREQPNARPWSCNGKERFDFRHAVRTAKRMNRRKSIRGKVEAYHCEVCRAWHVGGDR